MLLEAVCFKYVGCCEFLLQNGISPNLIIDKEFKGNILHYALMFDSLDLAKVFIKYGGNIDAQDHFGSPLLVSSQYSNTTFLEFLINNKADINNRHDS